MSRKIALNLVVLSLILSACGAIEAAQAFTRVGNDFMTALKDGDYEAAYAFFHPGLQENFGTVEDLKKGVEDNAVRPKDWSFSSVNATTDADKVTTAKMEGSVTYQDGGTGAVTLEMVQVDADWKIISFNLAR